LSALAHTPVALSAAGIDRSRVEDMEARLKRDVLREAARYDNHILVTEEDDDMNVSCSPTIRVRFFRGQLL